MNYKLKDLVLFIFAFFIVSFILIYAGSHKNPITHQIVTVGEPINFNLLLPKKIFNNLETNVMDPVRVIPGGQSIGIMVHGEGVVVAGLCTVTDEKGNEYSPAMKAGIKTGDIIVKIDGKKVKSDSHVQELVSMVGMNKSEAVFHILRNKETLLVKISPVLCADTGKYKVGLYIRDGAAGVGTLTFYEPETMVYGALGHVIVDMDTSESMNLRYGCIVNALIQTVHRGQRGQPGEKIGLFESKKDTIGNIEKNTPCGIFGRLEGQIYNPIYPEPIPVADRSEIKEGPAEILTVLRDNKIEKFSIEIQRLNSQFKTSGKDLVIRIDDERLLKETGGIIQGMSGSPIIQNKKLVGAVTHVFINDPTRGYGVLVERMLKEAGVVPVDGDKIPRSDRLGIFLRKEILLAG